jgi:methionine biosynthesis protein MetW
MTSWTDIEFRLRLFFGVNSRRAGEPMESKDSNGKKDQPEHQVILDWIKPGASVLDLGCGDGKLLYLLIKEKGCRAQGVEIDEQEVYKCVAKGLSVFHENIEEGLTGFGNKTFDYAILDQTFQQIQHVDRALERVLRIGKKVIVVFPNFAYFKSRIQIFIFGRTPVTRFLPFKWYETPNLHFLSILDFIEYCRRKGFRISRAIFLDEGRRVRFFPNLLAQVGLFLITKEDRID